MSSSHPRTLLLALAALAAASPVLAQAPDCSGVSGVFPSNADLINNLTTVRVAAGLSSPVFATEAPGDHTRLFILEQVGRIRMLKNGVLSTFLDISGLVNSASDERGLLSLAFHPDYQNNGLFWVYYTNLAGNVNVVRYTRSSPDAGNPASAVTLLNISHPISNHNGGTLAFSPEDGHLYMTIGDGGSACDPGTAPGNAQNLNVNLGKLMRLDPSLATPAPNPAYTTTGNPYDGGIPGNNEIWAFGLRNPFRFTFDRITQNIYIGDVGQNNWEEIDCRAASSNGTENYGWVLCEGNHCPNPSCPEGGAAPANYVAPIREYSLAGTPCAVIGGYVYRGCRMATLRGTYFYADNCAAFIRSFRTDATCAAGAETDRTSDLAPGGGLSIANITSFGEDNQGELYVVDRGGEVFKILPNLSIMEVSGPGALSMTLGPDLNFEDLQASSGHVLQAYKVYRAINNPTGTFTCIKRVLESVCAHGVCTWVGGDPSIPAAGQVAYYLVTAQTASGEESTAGARSDGVLRSVDTSSICPP